jgi:hypothetical protein
MSGRAILDPSPFFGERARRTSLREPAVGEFGNGPTFVSNPSKTKKAKSSNREEVIAMRAEFVVKPGKEEQVRDTIDLILNNSFGRDREFLQALVLESEQESRLVTVITFWRSDGFTEARERRVLWLRQKLAPYLDQSMRVQTFSARVMESAANSKQEEFSETPETYSAASDIVAACVS